MGTRREVVAKAATGVPEPVSKPVSGPFIDLNADVGEVEDPELLEVGVLQIVTSANIATGAHAGNPTVMDAAVRYATQRGISVGAHPSYPDRGGFGRRVIDIDPKDFRADLLAQIGALDAIANANGVRIRHVKPHGALYHQAAADDECARLVAEVVDHFDGAALVVPAGSPVLEAPWVELRMISEAFCDRGYRSDGSLVPRGEVGDLFAKPEQAAEQAVSIATEHRATGGRRHVGGDTADSLCLHADTPGAPAISVAVRAALEEAGVRVAAPH